MDGERERDRGRGREGEGERETDRAILREMERKIKVVREI